MTAGEVSLGQIATSLAVIKICMAASASVRELERYTVKPTASWLLA